MVTDKRQAIVSGEEIYEWFSLGLQEVQANKKHLNAINMFPIPDGDTGTNLFVTIKAMIETVTKQASFNEMIKIISNQGLAHARGNSGVLFASYINGLAIESSGLEKLTISDFAKVTYRAIGYLYQSIENPVEGTMISVISDWATYMFQNQQRYNTFQEMFVDAFTVAKNSLAKTAEQLLILKRNHLVDAGAEGFVNFLHGINRFYTGDQIEITKFNSSGLVFDIEDDLSAYRYCTEVFLLINAEYRTISQQELRERIKKALKECGDSLIVSLINDQARIHIHTNEPIGVIDIIKQYGTLIEQKADDMFMQKSVRTNRLSSIGILTDSIADLPDEYKLNYQIHTLPLGIIVDDIVYLDKLTINPQKIFEAIDNGSYPTSSQAEPLRIKTFIENLLEIYDSLIFITVSSQLSKTYQAVSRITLNIDKHGKKVSIIDSKLNSGAQGLIVKKAMEMVLAGLSHDVIVEEIQKLIARSSIYVCLNTIEYAVHSGRIPNTIGHLGMKLKMRPIMSLNEDGKGTTFDIGFSQKSLTKKIYRLLKKYNKETGIAAYSIVHCDNEKLANIYQKELTELLSKEPEYISDISSIIALHSGPGCVAVSFIKEERRG